VSGAAWDYGFHAEAVEIHELAGLELSSSDCYICAGRWERLPYNEDCTFESGTVLQASLL